MGFRVKRRQYIVDREFQYNLIRSIALLGAVVIFVSLLIFVVAWQFYGEVMLPGVEPFFYASQADMDVVEDGYSVFDMLWPVIGLSLVLNLGVILVFGVLVSHRMAGPVYRIRQDLNTMAENDFTIQIVLRKRDAFKPLVEDINLFKLRLRMILQEMMQIAEEEEEGPLDRLKRIRRLLETFRF